MPINGLHKVAEAFDKGRVHYQYVYKAGTPAAATVGFYQDFNQSAGIPKYNPFVGSSLTATPLVGSGNNGIYTGNYINGFDKYLVRLQTLSTNASSGNVQLILNDYLMFYPLIDADDTEIQEMDNTLTLPRYESGEGVRIVLIATAPMVSTAPCTITYTNSDGVSGRVSTFNVIPAASIGVCATGTGTNLGGAGQVTPFWPLASGDKGVRSIESIQFATAAGGFVTAALVKPLTKITNFEVGIPTEKMYGIDQTNFPKILQGAYLNFMCITSGTIGVNFRAELIFANI